MPQAVVLLLFGALLVFCVASGLSILYALAGGYLLFAGFAVFRGYGLKEVWEMSLEGVCTVSGILITFLFIGMLTASWRAAGTIPDIVIFVSDLIRPEFFLVLIFFEYTALGSHGNVFRHRRDHGRDLNDDRGVTWRFAAFHSGCCDVRNLCWGSVVSDVDQRHAGFSDHAYGPEM